MFNKNEYFDQFFKEILEPEETYNHYFYAMEPVSFMKYLSYHEGAVFDSKHFIISFTNKRILLCEMNLAGKLTGNIFSIDLNDVKNIFVKRGLITTKITIQFLDNSTIVFKPNNILIGASNHKMHLLKLAEKFQDK